MNGFLNTVTGAKVKAVIDSVSAPRDKDDDRTGSQRRSKASTTCCDSILANGLPSDKGVRPHLSVFVDADTLEAAAQHVKDSTEKPYLIREPDARRRAGEARRTRHRSDPTCSCTSCASV